MIATHDFTGFGCGCVIGLHAPMNLVRFAVPPFCTIPKFSSGNNLAGQNRIVTGRALEHSERFFGAHSYVSDGSSRCPANSISGTVIFMRELDFIFIADLAKVFLLRHSSALVRPFALPDLYFLGLWIDLP